MKKFICLFISLILVISVFAGCGSTATPTEGVASDASKSTESNKKLSIVTTIFPEYDWVKQIVGDNKNVDITMLINNGTDLHSYQPTTSDIAKLSSADMFIYVGGEADKWVDDALKNKTNKNMVVINLLKALGDKNIKEEEEIEGMMPDTDDDEDDGPEYDEHVWLSLKNAKTLSSYIEDKLKGIDSANSDKYDSNLKSYTDKLDSLDKNYQSTVDSAKYKTLVFGDRFPFRYMVDDYGLKYFAAFKGCTGETEASFETIAFLAKKVDELGVNNVVKIEGKNDKIAETIVQNTQNKNQQILTLDSMQSTTSKDVESGTTYLSVMTGNLDVLKKALN